MALTNEAKYLREFKANTKNCKFKGIVRNDNRKDLYLLFTINLDYTWQAIDLRIPVNELPNAGEVNSKLKFMLSVFDTAFSFDYVMHGRWYRYMDFDKIDKAKLRQLRLTDFEYVIAQITDLDELLDAEDNRSSRPRIRFEVNGLITMGPFVISDFVEFKQSYAFNNFKGLNNFDNEPFTITTNYFGQNKTSKLQINKSDGESFIIKAGDFDTSWRFVERIGTAESNDSSVGETNTMAFEL